MGTLTSLFTGDSTGLARSPKCGYYHHILDAPEETKILGIGWEKRAQDEVGTYAVNCYGGRGTRIGGCNLFAKQSLPYVKEGQVSCPFRGEMCKLGEQGAVAFATPPLPAQILGFNTNIQLEFQRYTTCAPLVSNETFTTYGKSLGEGYEGTWDFHYGPLGSLSKFTHSGAAPAKWTIGNGYSVT